MSECKKWLDVLLLCPAVAHEDTFLVFHCQAVLVISVQSVGCIVLKFYRECERKFSRRIYLAQKHVCDCMTCLRSEEPAFHDSVHFVNPRHFYGIAGNDNYDDVVIYFCKSLDDLVLCIRQSHRRTVTALCVLTLGLVQTTEEQYEVCVFGLCYSIGDKLLFTARISEVDTCVNAIICAEQVAYISSLIYDFGLVSHSLEQTDNRSTFVLCLER